MYGPHYYYFKISFPTPEIMSSTHINLLDDITTPTIWTVVESNVTIISACLIVSRPFFVKMYPQRLIDLVHDLSSSKKAHPDKTPRWHRSTPARFFFSNFKPLTDTPPAVTNVSLGGPFEVDMEQNWGACTRTKRADLEP